MIATAAMLAAIGQVAPPERILAVEFFDALERSIDTYGLGISPSLLCVKRDDGEVEVQPCAFLGHVIHFAIRVETTEPELAQTWITAAWNRCYDLNLLPHLIAEAIVAYNMHHGRPHEQRLTWTETCLVLGLRRET